MATTAKKTTKKAASKTAGSGFSAAELAAMKVPRRGSSQSW
jgi:hypothetical protein